MMLFLESTSSDNNNLYLNNNLVECSRQEVGDKNQLSKNRS